MRGLGAAFGISVAAHVAVATGAYVAWPQDARWDQPTPIVADLVYAPLRPSFGPAKKAPIIPAEEASRRETPQADLVRASRLGALSKATDDTFADSPVEAVNPPIAARLESAKAPEPTLTVTEIRQAIVSAPPALPIDPGQVRPTPRIKPVVPEHRPEAGAKEDEQQMSVAAPSAKAPAGSITAHENPSDAPESEAVRPSVAMLPSAAHESTPDVQSSAPQHAVPSLGNLPPKYPLAARRRGMEGRVVIEVRVDRHGEVATATVAVSSGHRLLDRAALGAVEKWTFQPARYGSRAVSVTIAIPITFALESSTVLAHE